MNRDHVPLTEAEWKIMLLLWEKSPRTMMELTRALAEDTGWSKHTVITMLKRMAVKGTVRICEDGPVKTYFPAVAKDRACASARPAGQPGDLCGLAAGGAAPAAAPFAAQSCDG